MLRHVRRHRGRLVLGLLALVASVALGWERYVTGASRGFPLEWLWPFVFGAAALATLAYTVTPSSVLWWRLSGPLLLAAFGSRVGAVVAVAVRTEWTAGLVIGAAVWSAFAAIVYTNWPGRALPEDDRT